MSTFVRCAIVFSAIVGFIVVATFRGHKTSCHLEHISETNSEVQRSHDVISTPAMLGRIDPSRKYAVFSTTSAANTESLSFTFLLPLTALAWKRIGFDSLVIIVGPEDVWNSDPLLYFVLTSLRRLDAVIIFVNVHPTNAVMVSQVRNPVHIWRSDATESRVTIRSPFCGYNMA